MPDAIQSEVRQFVAQGLEPSFSVERFDFDHGEAVLGTAQPGGSRTATVTWTVRARHTGRFVGIAPTERSISIRGCTVVDLEATPPRHEHFVDWSRVFAGIGVGITGRPVSI